MRGTSRLSLLAGATLIALACRAHAGPIDDAAGTPDAIDAPVASLLDGLPTLARYGTTRTLTLGSGAGLDAVPGLPWSGEVEGRLAHLAPPIPEPTTLALLTLGLGSLVAVSRLRIARA